MTCVQGSWTDIFLVSFRGQGTSTIGVYELYLLLIIEHEAPELNNIISWVAIDFPFYMSSFWREMRESMQVLVCIQVLVGNWGHSLLVEWEYPLGISLTPTILGNMSSASAVKAFYYLFLSHTILWNVALLATYKVPTHSKVGFASTKNS